MLSSINFRIRDDYEGDDVGVNQLFTQVFKIDGDATMDRGLYLAQSPIGLIRVADKHTGNELALHSVTFLRSCLSNLQ